MLQDFGLSGLWRVMEERLRLKVSTGESEVRLVRPPQETPRKWSVLLSYVVLGDVETMLYHDIKQSIFKKLSLVLL